MTNPKRKFIPYNKHLLDKARENRKNPTPAEKKMWFEILGGKSFQNLKFTRQKPLLSYILDFYCAELKLVVEIDGNSHAERNTYDSVRTNALKQQGVTVVRYCNIDIMNNIEGVYENLSEKVAALKNIIP